MKKCTQCGIEVDTYVAFKTAEGYYCAECHEKRGEQGAVARAIREELNPTSKDDVACYTCGANRGQRCVLLDKRLHPGRLPQDCPSGGESLAGPRLQAFFSDKVKADPVEHPPHYTMGPVEVIDALESFFPGVDFHKANAIKYLARAGHKDDELEDLRKAQWYVARAISRLDG